MYFARAWLVALCWLSFGGTAGAATFPEIERGLSWLDDQPRLDGTLINEVLSVAAVVQARAEAFALLHAKASVPAPALDALLATPEDNTEFVARKAIVAGVTGRDAGALTALLVARQNADGGFAPTGGYQSSALDTSWTLLALRATGFGDAAVIQGGLGFLAQRANADGGFGPSGRSDLFHTAYALMGLRAHSVRFGAPLAAQLALDWIAARRVQGAYGSVIDNAIATLALHAASIDNTLYAGAVSALRAAQSGDGSWGGDPYATALALSALIVADGTPSPDLTGSVSGTLRDPVSGAPIAGAQIVVTGPTSLAVFSGPTGAFLVSGLAPGQYTLEISKAGYATMLATVQVAAAAIASLGSLQVPRAATTATLQGRVTDGGSGAPLAGASVSVPGVASAVTDAAGAYAITGLLPGAFTVTASKAGYDSANGAGQLEAGRTVVFSPSLYPRGQTPADASVRGRVVDRDSDAPLPDVTVSIGALAATSDSSGAFALTGIVPGTTGITLAAAGYQAVSLVATLSAGLNELGSLELARQPATLALSGRVTDLETSLPIGGALVQLTGTDLRAASDPAGVYRLDGIAVPEFALSVSAPGYSRRALNVSLPELGDTTVDIAMQRLASDGLSIRSVRTDKPAYDPYTSIEIEVEVANASSRERRIAFVATVFDPQGRAVIEIPARGVVPALVELAGNAQSEIELETYAADEPAGLYSIEVRGYDGDGGLVLEGSASFSLNPVRRFAGGIRLDPPIAQAGTHQPVGITLGAYNHGNLAIPAGPVQLVVTLDRPDPFAGQRAHSIAHTILSGPFLNGVVAAAYDAQGVLYAVNRTDRRVLRIAPDGVTTLATLPALFTNPSVAVNPVDIALDAAGDIYVLNQTLEVFKVSAGGAVARIRTGLAAQTAFHLDAGGAFYILEKTTGTASLSRFVPGAAPIVLIGKGLSRPVGMAIGGDGQVYVANFGENSVVRLTSTGAVQPFVTGLDRPQGMVADAAGNFYVANSGANNVVKIAPDGGVSVFATGLNDPYALAFDSAGDLLVTNRRDATIAKVRGDGSVATFARGLTLRPQGMRYDASGNLYVVGDNGVSRLGASGGIALLSTLADGWGIALGANGEPYLTRPGAGQVVRIGSGGAVPVASGLASPLGLAFDPGGTLYVVENSASRISAIDAAGQRSTVAESYLSAPEDVVVAPDGDIYVLNAADIGQLTASGGKRIGQSLGAARSLAVGPDGVVYLEEVSAIRRVDASGTATPVRTGLPTLARGIAMDTIGNVYVAETAARELKRLEPGGAYTRVATFGAQPVSLTRDALGIIYVLLSTGQVLSVDEAGAVGTVATVSGVTRIARHSGDKLYLLHSAGVSALDLATKTVASLIEQSGLTALAVGAAGEVLVVHGTRNELQVYDPQGTLLRTAAGFSGPRDLVWTGSEMVFNAGGFLYALAPGSLPRIAGSGSATRLDARDGVVYATNSSGLSRLTPGGTLQPLFSQPGFPEPSGVAARADGAISVASLTADRVLTVNKAGQVLASYAGINTLSGLAVDAQDNTYAVSDSGRQIVRIAPDGAESEVFASGGAFDMLAFDANGRLHAANGKQLIRFDAAGVSSVVATSSGVFNLLGGILLRPEGILVADHLASMVRKVDAGDLTVFSAGLDDPRRVKIGPDGAAYVVSWANGTVLRVAPGGADLYAANLVAPTALDFGAGGVLYVAEASGPVVRVDPSGAQTRHQDLAAVLGAIDVDTLTVSPSQALAVARSRTNDLVKVTLLPAVPAPQPGTVVHTAIADLPEIATGPAPVNADFGSWVPPYGGDFRFSVRSLTGVEGEAVNLLHVGPGASGAIIAARDVLPPGDAPVAVQLNLRGADLSTVTRVEAGNVRLYATKVIDLTPGSAQVMPRSIGADAAGNVYFTFNKDLRRVTPGADPVVVYRGAHTIQMLGGIPVDDAQNLYVTGGATGRDVLRIAQDGRSATVASLPDTVLSLVRGSRDDLYALTAGGIHRIGQDGSVTALGAAGVDRPISLTIDGHDNLYVHNLTNEVVKIARDGSVSAVVADPQVVFEYEGANIAGDCAGNLFVTPYRWPAVGQDGEEHTLVQVAGANGQVSQVLDGRTIHSDLTDMDFIVYDRFGEQLLIWTDTAAGRVYSVPVRCGVIDTGLHLVLPAGQQASGFSAAPNAVVDRSDGSTEYAWSLEGVGEAGRSLQFDTILHGLTLGEQRALAAESFLLFTNTFVAGQVKVPLSVPTVRVEAPVRLDVATDRPAYAPGSVGYADLRLTNQDAGARQGRLVGAIVDRAGLTVSRVADQSIALPGGATADVLAPFDTATWPPGAYTVTATLVAGDVELARASAALDVVTAEAARSAAAAIGTDKAAYSPADTVRLRARVGNLRLNAPLDALSIVTRILNPDGTLRFDKSEFLALLPEGGQRLYEYALPLGFAAPGSYRATLSVHLAAGEELAEASTVFETLSSGVTGSGLTGTVAAMPKAVSLGEVAVLSLSATNQGNAAMASIGLKLRVIDPATAQAVAQFAFPADLDVGQSMHAAVSWTAAGTPGSTYVVALLADVGAGTLLLAQDLVTVTAPPVDVAVAYGWDGTPRVLVLAACGPGRSNDDRGADEDHGRDDRDEACRDGNPQGDGDACAQQRAAFLREQLTALGVEHLVVTRREDFRLAQRCGRYNLYWLSGGAIKLDHLTVKALRDAVFRGDSLLTDGAHDEHNGLLDEVAGVRYRGHLPGADHSVALGGALFAPAQAASRGTALKLEAAGGEVQATFAAGGTPAVLTRQYGRGRGLAVAFDLRAALAADAGSVWREALLAMLGYLTPGAPETILEGGFVPLATPLQNRGQAATLEVRIALPAGVAALSSAPAATVSAAEARWIVDLAAGQSTTLRLGLRLPLGAAHYDFDAGVGLLRNGRAQPYGSYPLQLAAIGFEELHAQAQAALASLQPAGASERAKLAHARDELDDARAALEQGDLQEVMEELLDALDDLRGVNSVPVEPARLSLAWLLKNVELRWCHEQCNPPAPREHTGMGFVPFAPLERLEVRGGRPGSADWEWALGSNTRQTGHFVEQNLDWASGRTYRWTLRYDARGGGAFTVWDGWKQLFSRTYPGNTGPLRAGNALELRVKSAASAGSARVSVTADSINGKPVKGSLGTPGNHKPSEAALYYFYPAMAAGFTAGGTVKLKFSGSSPPRDADLQFSVTAGNVRCAQ